MRTKIEVVAGDYIVARWVKSPQNASPISSTSASSEGPLSCLSVSPEVVLRGCGMKRTGL